MGFKKIRYNTGECLVKIKIEEDSGAMLENWVFMMSDLENWYNTMEKKYGNRIKSKKVDRDLDWLK